MFMLMLMLLPPVGADITQISKFFDPIKNASFEDATPQWETNNGGYRELTTCPDGSYAWYTSGGGEYQMWQWLDSEALYDIKGKRVSFSFWFKPDSLTEDFSARAGIYYEQYYNGEKEQSTVWGDWVFPDTSDWYNTHVEDIISGEATDVKVLIHGQTDFKAWIDLASLCIYTTRSEYVDWPNQEATVTVSATMFQLYEKSPKPPSGFPDCIAYLAVGMGVERHNKPDKVGSVCVRGIELDVKLLTEGHLNIYYCEQSNEHNLEIDPEKQEELQNQVLMAGGIALSAGIAAFTYYLPVAAMYKPFISVTSGTIGKLILQSFASDPHIQSADEVGEYVRENGGLRLIIRCGSLVKEATA